MTKGKRIITICLCLIVFIVIGDFIYSSNLPDYYESNQKPEQITGVKESTTIKNIPTQSNSISKSNSDNIPEPIDTEQVASNIRKTAQSISNPQPIISSVSKKDSADMSSNIAAPNKELINTVQQKVGQPISMTDLFQAASIILAKLSTQEINYLFDLSKSTYTREDLEKARNLLLDKLTADDINILRALAQKYGKKLDILDPNQPIE